MRFGFPLDSPCDIFDLISKYGLDLRFTGVGSLDGMYLNDGLIGSINVSALRPAGLQRFTAAHELGHFIFDHGARLDQDVEKMISDSNEETIADAFARHILMPRRAVVRGFANFGRTALEASPEEFHAVAAWLGVGYTTLVQQSRWTLKLIDYAKYHDLTLKQPQQIKRTQLPAISWIGKRELWPLASWWNGVRVHVQVGDVLTGVSAPPIEYFDLDDGCIVARKPGQCYVDLYSGESIQINIARTNYVGMYQYRYLEEVEDA